ncbi:MULTISPECIES: hypothetical protein [Streptococcus]|mgnify:FL=1|jgi:hypothetical protein|uniref:DUF262 domain-containing protein n=1 Tax=Streptococcus hohhotensis TaxID=2866998 RepID=A0ABT6QEW6_9STRE|nr:MULTISPECIES: hypothetical protein [unclassified Streptococcus]MDI2140015.1 hypothetical protein [Streptococcus sp. IMAU 99199]
MVKILSRTEDRKIQTSNYLIELELNEYLEFAENIISNNEYQRKRVRSSMSIYSQLKEDLKYGCIIPPIVLAIDSKDMSEEELNQSNIKELLKKSLILDGLQRTFTIIDAYNELIKEGRDTSLFLKGSLHAEVYGGINRFGLLYRMLTLNTGQTPMTLRHQIEILYSNYDVNIPDIILIKEVEGRSPRNIGEYRFQDIIDGFVSYLQSSYLPMTRSTILETIKTLETISSENVEEDLFKTFVQCYNSLLNRMNSMTSEDDTKNMNDLLSEDDSLLLNAESVKTFLFAESIFSLMSKSQVMTGFGAGLSLLKQKNKISSISDISRLINSLEGGGDYAYDWFLELNKNLYIIKQNSSKIGNSQRMYFSEFFRLLFDESAGCFLNLYETSNTAMEVYTNKMGI